MPEQLDDLFEGMDIPESLKKKLSEKDEQLEKDIQEGKIEKPKDSPFECVGCGSWKSI